MPSAKRRALRSEASLDDIKRRDGHRLGWRRLGRRRLGRRRLERRWLGRRRLERRFERRCDSAKQGDGSAEWIDGVAVQCADGTKRQSSSESCPIGSDTDAGDGIGTGDDAGIGTAERGWRLADRTTARELSTGDGARRH